MTNNHPTINTRPNATLQTESFLASNLLEHIPPISDSLAANLFFHFIKISVSRFSPDRYRRSTSPESVNGKWVLVAPFSFGHNTESRREATGLKECFERGVDAINKAQYLSTLNGNSSLISKSWHGTIVEVYSHPGKITINPH